MCAPYSLARSNHHQFNNHLKPGNASKFEYKRSNHHQFNNHLKQLKVLIIM